jgi:hypothetical protein
MEDTADTETEPPSLDESIDGWLLDIRNAQIESEARRKSYLTRETLGNFSDEEIQRIMSALSPNSGGIISIKDAAENIVRRVEQLGPDGVEKLVRNGCAPPSLHPIT